MPEELDSAGTAATANLLASTLTRRSMLLKAGAASGGLAVAGGLFGALKAEAAQSSILSEPPEVTPYLTIFKVAQSAEQLAITLYRNGVANASKLGLSAQELNYFKAAGIEEQIHHTFFAGITGVAVQPAATHFSFPHGHDTFTDLKLFITAQQQLEGVFDTAFLAAVRELSHWGHTALRRSRPRSPPSNQSIASSVCRSLRHTESRNYPTPTTRYPPATLTRWIRRAWYPPTRPTSWPLPRYSSMLFPTRSSSPRPPAT